MSVAGTLLRALSLIKHWNLHCTQYWAEYVCMSDQCQKIFGNYHHQSRNHCSMQRDIEERWILLQPVQPINCWLNSTNYLGFNFWLARQCKSPLSTAPSEDIHTGICSLWKVAYDSMRFEVCVYWYGSCCALYSWFYDYILWDAILMEYILKQHHSHLEGSRERAGQHYLTRFWGMIHSYEANGECKVTNQ